MKNLIFLFTVLCILSCKTTKIEKVDIRNKSELITYVDSIFSVSNIPGLSYAVFNEDGLFFERSFGYSDLSTKKKFTNETIINIASISKTVIAVALMKAVDEGYVSLDEDINTYLPFKVSNPHYPTKKITLRQLATHTSSIVDSEVYTKAYYFYDVQKLNAIDFGDELAEYFELVKDNELIDDAEFLENALSVDGIWYDENIFSTKVPGSEAAYSNIGASLAAFVIESATGIKYEDYTTQKIFEPLGMHNTTWQIEEKHKANFTERYLDMNTAVPPYYLITKADGGLYTTVKDFTKYMQEMAKGLKGNGTILTNEGYKTMFSVQLKGHNNFDEGIFWELPLGKGFAHDGSDPGVTTRTSYHTERQRGLIFFCNVEATEKSISGINEIWDAVALFDWK